MSKRKTNKLAKLILTICSLAAAVLSAVALSFNFYVYKTKVGSFENNVKYSFKDWLKLFENLDSDKLATWNIARILLFVTLALVAVMVVMTMINLLFKNKALSFITTMVGVLTVVCAVVFLITSLNGASVFDIKAFGKITSGYQADIGVYMFSIAAIVSAIFAECAVMKK